jgi:hypothetical protein
MKLHPLRVLGKRTLKSLQYDLKQPDGRSLGEAEKMEDLYKLVPHEFPENFMAKSALRIIDTIRSSSK